MKKFYGYKEKICMLLTFSVPATYPPQLFNVVKERPHLHLSSCRTAPIFHISPFPPFFPVNVFYTKPIQKGTTFFAILINSLGTFLQLLDVSIGPQWNVIEIFQQSVQFNFVRWKCFILLVISHHFRSSFNCRLVYHLKNNSFTQ